MGRFDRKIQRKNALPRSPVAFDRKHLLRAGFALAPDNDPGLADYPPLASQLEAMATPVLENYREIPEEGLHPILGIVVLSWNIGFLLANSGGKATAEQLVDSFLGKSLQRESAQERDAMLGMCRSLCRMRAEFFGHDPRIIENFAVKRLPGGGYQFFASGVAAFPAR